MNATGEEAFSAAPDYETPAGVEDEIPLRATRKRKAPILWEFFVSLGTTEGKQQAGAICLLPNLIKSDRMFAVHFLSRIRNDAQKADLGFPEMDPFSYGNMIPIGRLFNKWKKQ